MPDIAVALDTVFTELSQEFEIEEIKSSPRTWRLVIQAELDGKAEDVEMNLSFPTAFPYDMPRVEIKDERFKYLPHISFHSRKLCLYEDGVIYDATNIRGIVRDCIRRARRWVEEYANRDNSDEYAKEIKNYWEETYDNETLVDDFWIILGKVPSQTCLLNAISYPVKSLSEKNIFFERVICACELDEDQLKPFKSMPGATMLQVVYVASFNIPQAPPYSLTGMNVIDRISDDNDRRFIVKYINDHHKGYILFPLGLDFVLGGVIIPKLNTNRKGFRPETLRAINILTGFENTNKNLDRILAKVYNADRIAQRTVGKMMEFRKFLVAGLGSIGSNLCYYLNGYNNAQFALIDKDFLNTENLGRHLLGFEYINQRKSFAVAQYLTQYRPDRKVKALAKDLQEIQTERINESSALFVCTGDVMSEQWLLKNMVVGHITVPAFILWLEPYGISGIMLYVNPSDKEGLKQLCEQADDSFLNYCLIDRCEYDNGEKLIKQDVGCNGNYALYSANDVTFFLSAMFPHIDNLLTSPSTSKCYRWTGNIDTADQKEIKLVSSDKLSKHEVLELPL